MARYDHTSSAILLTLGARGVAGVNLKADEALPPLRAAAGEEAALFLIECADGFTCAVHGWRSRFDHPPPPLHIALEQFATQNKQAGT